MGRYSGLLLLILLCSCKQAEAPFPAGTDFNFEQPQPVDVSELDHFPSKFIGFYKSDSLGFLRFEKTAIIAEYHDKFMLHEKVLDSLKDNYDWANGKLVEKNNQETYEVTKAGDSVQLLTKRYDTIFRFSLKQKIKRINGFLVLSQKDSIYWKVQLVGLEKGTLKIRYLASDGDLKSLDSITAIHSEMIDSAAYLIRPTRKEFKKILHLKNLSYEKNTKKSNNPNMKIIAFAGSNSKSSINKKLATYAASLFQNAESEILDLNDFAMPLFSVDLEKEIEQEPKALEFLEKLSAADVIILSLAENNGNYSAAFKNVFDWASRINKMVFQQTEMLLMATSPGARGGKSVLEIAEGNLPRYGANIKAVFSLPEFYKNFDMENGKIATGEFDAQLKEIVRNFSL